MGLRLERVLSLELVRHPNVEVIEFNPLTERNLSKRLGEIAALERAPADHASPHAIAQARRCVVVRIVSISRSRARAWFASGSSIARRSN